jgi:5-bromo-4-chloroindolyl phosphate hydrolysis protein
MNNWEKDVSELKTDIKYIREDINVMQKQIRDLNKTSHMGVGGIKVFLAIGSLLAAVWGFIKITD